MNRRCLVLSIAASAVACTTVQVTPVPVSPLRVGSSERVVVDQALVIVDASASIDRRTQFPREQALVQSFIDGMPNGSYEAGSVAFGGVDRTVQPLAAFDRAGLRRGADTFEHFGHGTPLYAVFDESQDSLRGKGGRAAVFVFTDGVLSDPGGNDVDPASTLDAARSLASRHGGTLCIYTIQIGDDPEGADFLRSLSDATGCGSHRLASSLGDEGGIHALQREAFLGAAPAAASPRDSDRDGVFDAADRCPSSPTGSRVDDRGCWVIEGLNFATNSADLDAASIQKLEREVVPVLSQNPNFRLRVDGHTDSRGAAAYNRDLSERRAKAVRDQLVALGVAADRLTAQGFGEDQPIAPNDTAANLRRNRRTELTVVR